ncbi:hypothetical protein MW887_007665 [Aspergillus wentii]|nr:hypothetical protein MW887_007665 [Aspergillus wentii]
MSQSPSIVIVPGAWHCPQHYTRLINGLNKANYDAVAVATPSYNSSPPHASWDQDAQAVRDVILEKLEKGQDVIAVGHSFGGVVMSEAVKGLGKKARTEQGQTHLGQMKPQSPEEEELERQRQEMAEKHGGMQLTEDGAIILPKDIIRDVFYNRCDPNDVQEALDLLGSFPPGPMAVPATYTAYLEIPSTYIVCDNDNALPAVVQERIIAEGKGAFDVERCEEGHSPFLSNPEFIVDCIRKAAGDIQNR